MTSLHPDYYDFDLYKATFEIEIAKRLDPLMPSLSWDVEPPKGQSVFKYVGRAYIRVHFPEFPETKLCMTVVFVDDGAMRAGAQKFGIEWCATQSASEFARSVLQVLQEKHGYYQGMSCN